MSSEDEALEVNVNVPKRAISNTIELPLFLNMIATSLSGEILSLFTLCHDNPPVSVLVTGPENKYASINRHLFMFWSNLKFFYLIPILIYF